MPFANAIQNFLLFPMMTSQRIYATNLNQTNGLYGSVIPTHRIPSRINSDEPMGAEGLQSWGGQSRVRGGIRFSSRSFPWNAHRKACRGGGQHEQVVHAPHVRAANVLHRPQHPLRVCERVRGLIHHLRASGSDQTAERGPTPARPRTARSGSWARPPAAGTGRPYAHHPGSGWHGWHTVYGVCTAGVSCSGASERQ